MSYGESGCRGVTAGNVEVVTDDCHLSLTETLLTVNLFGHDRDPDSQSALLSLGSQGRRKVTNPQLQFRSSFLS